MDSRDKLCAYCGRKFGSDSGIPSDYQIKLKRTKDHIIPKSKGGWFHRLNIVDACHKCNSLKGDMTLQQFYDFLGAINYTYARLHGYHEGLIATIRRNISMSLFNKEKQFLKMRHLIVRPLINQRKPVTHGK